MGEMTDDEINTRLARIEGLKLHPACGTDSMDPGAFYEDPEQNQKYPFDKLAKFTPLTSWEQLGPLMERETIWISYEDDGTEGRWVASWPPHCGEELRHFLVTDPDLKRAVCLAIIAAHEDGREEG